MKFSFGMQEKMNFNIAAVSTPGGLKGDGIKSVSVMTESNYQALEEYDSQTLYIVQTADSILLYLGSVPLRIDDPTLVHGHGVTDIAAMTQEEYDALETPDETTLYSLK